MTNIPGSHYHPFSQSSMHTVNLIQSSSVFMSIFVIKLYINLVKQPQYKSNAAARCGVKLKVMMTELHSHLYQSDS